MVTEDGYKIVDHEFSDGGVGVVLDQGEGEGLVDDGRVGVFVRAELEEELELEAEGGVDEGRELIARGFGEDVDKAVSLVLEVFDFLGVLDPDFAEEGEGDGLEVGG